MTKGILSSLPVDPGDNPYVQGLVNAGWRWDTSAQTGDSGAIRWTIDSTGMTSGEVTALTNAAQAAFAEWAHVANIRPSFVAGNPAGAEIEMHIVPSNTLDFGGYSGTPFEATSNHSHLTHLIAELGEAHIVFSNGAVGGANLPVWTYDASGHPNGVTPTGLELVMHEIGHSLGLKHPHDYGASAYEHVFPGVTPGDSADLGDYNLNSKFGTIMSYAEAATPVGLPFGGAPGGALSTPMAFDIAAIQKLYGANLSWHAGDDTYELPDPGAANGQTWQCIWDTGGTDRIVYNGSADAVIDLRPATLDDSSTGAGMGSYTWNHTAVGRGGTIAGDILNALPDQGGVKGVVIEQGWGGSGNDLITGNDADNVLHGGAGNDTIAGLDGADIINGDTGNDWLDGGAGADRFVFELYFGHDTIAGFDADPEGGQDILDLAETGAVAANFGSTWWLTEAGGNTEVHINYLGENVITLLGVSVGMLDLTDFAFV